jgi:hypothetical protein
MDSRFTAEKPHLRRSPVRRGCVVVVLAAACLTTTIGLAAEGDLGTDRDAFTPCTHTIPAGSLLMEASSVYIDNRSGLPTNNYPEWLLRIGATERFEWRFGVNYGVGSQGTIVTSVEVGEGTLDGSRLYETSVLYGFKLAMSDQDDWLPETCFIMEGTTPVEGDVFGTVPVGTGAAGWELPVRFPLRRSEPWRLDVAVRYAYSEGLEGWFSRWTPSTVLRMPVTERWELHAEWFGSYPVGAPGRSGEPFFSPGTHVMLTKNFELGVRVGWGLTAEMAPFFCDAGCGWRW